MSIQVEISIPKQIFKTKVAGVTFENLDGSKRQEIIKHSRINEKIYLERDYENEFDVFAIKVLNKNRKQLGFVPSDSRLSRYIDSGGKTKSFIFRKFGGKTFFDKLFSKKGKPFGCIIEICKEGIDEDKSKKYDEFSKFDNDLKQRLEELYLAEKDDLTKSIEQYKDIIEIIKESDRKGNFEKANRYVKIPINRLTLLLEKTKDFEIAIEYIEWYKNYKDTREITKSDLESIEKRYNRLIKKRTPNNA
ncbi:HIRAN domain-containing protein [uncultured Lutibacter sp.]|uniref:HIRAN domain-containing protein n=1 Tax=uncultured Lutibacter sp. TaxID=437739 RepID=UPI0026397B21|nr:HIRAN domain-containing protein [uncultured Lutibacter sp.]